MTDPGLLIGSGRAADVYDLVFDWTNVNLGPPAADAAMAWVLGASSTVDGPWWVRAAALRITDRNVRPEEAARILSIVDQAAPASAT